MGINTKQSEDTVCGNGQQPYDRFQDNRKGGNQSAYGFGKLILMLHCHALGNKLTEHKGKVGKNKRNHNNSSGIDQTGLRSRYIKGLHKKAGKPFRKVIRRKRGA